LSHTTMWQCLSLLPCRFPQVSCLPPCYQPQISPFNSLFPPGRAFASQSFLFFIGPVPLYFFSNFLLCGIFPTPMEEQEFSPFISSPNGYLFYFFSLFACLLRPPLVLRPFRPLSLYRDPHLVPSLFPITTSLSFQTCPFFRPPPFSSLSRSPPPYPLPLCCCCFDPFCFFWAAFLLIGNLSVLFHMPGVMNSTGCFFFWFTPISIGPLVSPPGLALFPLLLNIQRTFFFCPLSCFLFLPRVVFHPPGTPFSLIFPAILRFSPPPSLLAFPLMEILFLFFAVFSSVCLSVWFFSASRKDFFLFFFPHTFFADLRVLKSFPPPPHSPMDRFLQPVVFSPPPRDN